MEVCFRTKQHKQGKGRGYSRHRGKSGRKRQGVRKIGDQPDQSNLEGSDVSDASDSTSDGCESNTLPLMIENEPVNVIIDSCNLMSEQVFDKVSKGKLELLKTDRKVYAYACQEPLKLSGKCMLNICVSDTQMSLKAEFFVMPGTADTLLGRGSSEELGVLKIGVTINACESRNVADKKATLKQSIPTSVYWPWKIEKFSVKAACRRKWYSCYLNYAKNSIQQEAKSC